MMEPDAIKSLIEAGIPGAKASVTGDGAHFDAIVISDAFDGLSLVKKQQLVYATVNDKIATGELHALSIKTFTTSEWSEQQG